VNPRSMAEKFVRELKNPLGERLQAAVLFGSAARGEWIEGVSDVNVLVLLDDIDAPVLAKAGPVAQDALGRGVRPLLMEVGEWRRAADVFTIELSDMRDASEPLFGDDPSSALVVQPSIMRLQAERELRAKLLHLHSGMLLVSNDRARVGQLLMHALPSFATYLRAILRLDGQAVPRDMATLIEQGCRRAGADPAAFLRVLEHRTAKKPFELPLTDPTVNDYNTAAEKLSAYIDTWGR